MTMASSFGLLDSGISPGRKRDVDDLGKKKIYGQTEVKAEQESTHRNFSENLELR